MLLVELGESGDWGLMANFSWDGEPIQLSVAEDRFAQSYSDELESLSLGLVDCGGEWSCDGELAPAPLEGELSIFGPENRRISSAFIWATL